jgi:hypothetical protein
MSDTQKKIQPSGAAGCPPPPGRRRLAARALVAALLVLIVAFGEVKLIERATAPEANGTGARDGLVHIVDTSLASGLAPIAILP